MVQAIKSKKFNIISKGVFKMKTTVLKGCCFAILATFIHLLTQNAVAQEGNLPKLENLGVIPVQWEASTRESLSEDFKSKINDLFYQSVVDSKRFRVANRDLIAKLWSTSENRAELSDSYEIDAFASLSVVVGSENLRFVSRILATNLDTLISETEVFPRAVLNAVSESQLKDKVDELFFRMIDRLPIDMRVISVQGKYVSLSGGKQQGVKVGEELPVVRSSVAKVHPADGSWLSYKNERVGRIKILEVKDQTSVATISSQSYDDAIQVNDGAKIPDIRSRLRFRRRQELIAEAKTQKRPPVIVAPLYDSSKRPKSRREPAESRETLKKEVDTSMPVESGPAPEDYYADEQSFEEDEGSTSSSFALSDTWRFQTGFRSWSVSGVTSAASKRPAWLIDHLVASTSIPWSSDIDIEMDGRLDFGATKNDGYVGLGVAGRGIHTMSLSGLPAVISNVRVGGAAEITSMSVQGEGFGGGEMLLLSGLAGIAGEGSWDPELPLKWTADFYLTPLGFGQLGYSGSKKSIGQVFGYALKTHAYLPADSGSITWGGGFDYINNSVKAGGTINWSEIRIFASAGMKL